MNTKFGRVAPIGLFLSIVAMTSLLAAGRGAVQTPPTSQRPQTSHSPSRAKKEPASDRDFGILLGDSVVRGFGRGPVYYNSRSPIFKPEAYRFVESADVPVASLAGYRGIKTWLNRGVTGNPSDAIVARWNRDVVERLDRGSQTKRGRTRAVLVSAGITDIGSAILDSNLRKAEANLQKNLLILVRLARSQGIRIAFLELPDPTKAPLGKPFHTLAGTPVKSFPEEHEYGPKQRRSFIRMVKQTRKFMETKLRKAGGEVIDYASFLPKEYFWDSHHPSDPGYVKLGRLLQERDRMSRLAPQQVSPKSSRSGF